MNTCCVYFSVSAPAVCTCICAEHSPCLQIQHRKSGADTTFQGLALAHLQALIKFEKEGTPELQQRAEPQPVMTVQAALWRSVGAAKLMADSKPVPGLAKLSDLQVCTAAEAIASHIMAAEVAVNGAAPVAGTADQTASAEAAERAVSGCAGSDGAAAEDAAAAEPDIPCATCLGSLAFGICSQQTGPAAAQVTASL